jgi:hypothetical protein
MIFQPFYKSIKSEDQEERIVVRASPNDPRASRMNRNRERIARSLLRG